MVPGCNGVLEGGGKDLDLDGVLFAKGLIDLSDSSHFNIDKQLAS